MRRTVDETALNIAAVSGRAGDLLADFCGAIAGMRRELGFGGIGPRGMFSFTPQSVRWLRGKSWSRVACGVEALSYWHAVSRKPGS
jgi:hypothetical protein